MGGGGRGRGGRLGARAGLGCGARRARLSGGTSRDHRDIHRLGGACREWMGGEDRGVAKGGFRARD